jgi:putative ABC transport system ATP-binding protein
MKNSNETIIRFKDVYKSYFLSNGDPVPVLKGIDLEIQKGEFVAIMGESGGGKSTLMNIIGCLHGVTNGQYFLEGEEISTATDDFTLAFIRNRKMGFIFQQFNLIGKLSALRNVALPAFYAGLKKKEREAKAIVLLKSVGLGDRINYKPTELSGGQQQRVSISRSLVNDPEVILADEPTGALDSQTGKEVMELFQKYKALGKTVIMVTHDMHTALEADKIIYMKDGKILDHNWKFKK